MEDLIPLVNRLQEAFAPVGFASIDLPQIAVVGSQSSGKSSVLESIVGRSLLPRGAGICTRRPLVIQLTNLADKSKPATAEFAHAPGKIYTDFETEVRLEIEAETERVVKGKKMVSAEPIILKIWSPHVVNLTLVDLPGLTKVPVGEQPANIVHVISDMVREFILNENCIILAVTPANQDVANSDGLQFAREVDPEGLRTIGVITKLDLMDEGTNCLDVLTGKSYPLRLGYVGVINRSQADIDRNKSLADSLESERKFLQQHREYVSLASRMGTPYLSRMLNRILEDHIKQVLPSITKRVKDSLRVASTELADIGDVVSTDREQRAVVLKSITSFMSAYEDAMEGRGNAVMDSALVGAARLRELFTGEFNANLASLGASQDVSDTEIMRIRKNVTGTKADLFVPNSAFEVLVKGLINHLEAPALDCVRAAHDELRGIVIAVLGAVKELQQFEGLARRIQEVAFDFLAQRCELTLEFVSNIVQMETAYINTDHAEFERVRKGVYNLMAAQQTSDVREAGASRAEGSKAAQTAVRKTPGQVQLLQAGGRPAVPATLRITARNLEIFDTQGANPKMVRQVPLEGCSIKDAATRANTLEIQLQRASFFSQAEMIAFTAASSEEMREWREMLIAARDSKGARARGGGGEVGGPQPARALGPEKLTDRERVESEILRQLLQSYFDIVRRNVQDAVPKAVMLMLVRHTQQKLQHELMSTIYADEDNMEMFTMQSESVVLRRAELQTTVAALRQALTIISEPHRISKS
mmetsp:Transcript_10305/g.23506  ORF Transcript_10305/g.23506 Transcript_10305/m.23506 type:complete len:760 (+) Transcript_10305:14-2293(+)